MSKTLVVAEKPQAARDYVDWLKKSGSFQKKNGYYESAHYIVTNSFGHLVSSKAPMDYESFGGWNWESIPFYPPNGGLDYHIPSGDKLKHLRDQMKVFRELFKRKDIDLVINGCDAGREGDLIFWEIYDHLGSTLPVKRLWVSAMTDSELKKGFENLKDESFFLPKRDAAYARQYADWFLGQNLTTGASIKANAGRAIHIGRVQTPTLAILVKRRQEIEQFVPQEYFVIDATFGGKYKGSWFKGQLSNIRFDKKEEADAVVDKITGGTGVVTKKDVKQEKTNPKPLFNLNDLQREGNKKYGFSAKKVLDIAQILYETYKYLSYPRSDSRHLSESQVPELETMINGITHSDYAAFTQHVLSEGIKVKKTFVDDAKVTDHHAIVPTTSKADLSRIVDDKKGHSRQDIIRIYDLVARRFLSVFYPPSIYEKTEIVTEVAGETFKTSGKILVQAGWEEVYGKDTDDDGKEGGKDLLPPIDKGESNPVTHVNMQAKMTKPPKHYTEDELLGVMEDPKRTLEDAETKELFVESKAGLGTSATRADTIDKLKARKYAEEKGKFIIATDDGINCVAIAPIGLKTPEVTAEWELKLSSIESGQLDRATFEREMEAYVLKNLEELKTSTVSVVFHSGREKVGTCPKCQKDVVEFPAGYACESSTKEHTCLRIWKSVAKKKLTASQVKQILTKGKTGMIKGFVSPKSGKKFDAMLTLDEERGGVKFLFEDRPEPSETSLPCPTCGKHLVDKGEYYACQGHTKETPCFTASKSIASKTLTENQWRTLLTKKRTELIKGFKGKTKKPFDAILVLEGTKVTFEFPKRETSVQKETDLHCPACGSVVTENDKAFGCSNFKTCKFTIWKVMSGRTMTKDVVKDLIVHKKTTDKLEGFISNNTKKAFSAYLVVDEKTGKVSFSFQ